MPAINMGHDPEIEKEYAARSTGSVMTFKRASEPQSGLTAQEQHDEYLSERMQAMGLSDSPAPELAPVAMDSEEFHQRHRAAVEADLARRVASRKTPPASPSDESSDESSETP